MFEKVTNDKENDDYVITVMLSKNELEDLMSAKIYKAVPQIVVKEMANYGIPEKQADSQAFFSSLRSIRRTSGIIHDKVLNYIIGAAVGAVVLYLTTKGISK